MNMYLSFRRLGPYYTEPPLPGLTRPFPEIHLLTLDPEQLSTKQPVWYLDGPCGPPDPQLKGPQWKPAAFVSMRSWVSQTVHATGLWDGDSRSMQQNLDRARWAVLCHAAGAMEARDRTPLLWNAYGFSCLRLMGLRALGLGLDRVIAPTFTAPGPSVRPAPWEHPHTEEEELRQDLRRWAECLGQEYTDEHGVEVPWEVAYLYLPTPRLQQQLPHSSRLFDSAQGGDWDVLVLAQLCYENALVFRLRLRPAGGHLELWLSEARFDEARALELQRTRLVQPDAARDRQWAHAWLRLREGVLLWYIDAVHWPKYAGLMRETLVESLMRFRALLVDKLAWPTQMMISALSTPDPSTELLG